MVDDTLGTTDRDYASDVGDPGKTDGTGDRGGAVVTSVRGGAG